MVYLYLSGIAFLIFVFLPQYLMPEMMKNFLLQKPGATGEDNPSTFIRIFLFLVVCIIMSFAFPISIIGTIVYIIINHEKLFNNNQGSSS